MSEQSVKTQNNQMINWMSYRNGILDDIEDVKQDIKDKTESERAKLKAYRKNLSIANFKIDQLMGSLQEQVEAQESVVSTLTLDDFDTDNKSIDINLAEGEYKQFKEEQKE